MTSDVVDIWPKDKRFFAKGKVVFEAKEARGASDSLEYIESDDRGGTARYIGNVELTQKDMKIVASRVDTRLQEGRISEANAVGAVTVNQGASRGTGESAVYQAKDETITLTGRPDRPAVVTDPRGRTEGLTVTMDRSGKNASVSPDPTTGRVTTRVPVKP
jgi:lipopolysaccharide transport protein LptA